MAPPELRSVGFVTFPSIRCQITYAWFSVIGGC